MYPLEGRKPTFRLRKRETFAWKERHQSVRAAGMRQGPGTEEGRAEGRVAVFAMPKEFRLM